MNLKQIRNFPLNRIRVTYENRVKLLTFCFLRVDYVEADMAHAHTPYHVVQTLITNLLELDTCRTASEKEHALLEHITDLKLREKMFLLNDLLGTHVSTAVPALGIFIPERQYAGIFLGFVVLNTFEHCHYFWCVCNIIELIPLGLTVIKWCLMRFNDISPGRGLLEEKDCCLS